MKVSACSATMAAKRYRHQGRDSLPVLILHPPHAHECTIGRYPREASVHRCYVAWTGMSHPEVLLEELTGLWNGIGQSSKAPLSTSLVLCPSVWRSCRKITNIGTASRTGSYYMINTSTGKRSMPSFLPSLLFIQEIQKLLMVTSCKHTGSINH